MTTTVFTLCSVNYLPQARVLGESLLHWNPDVRFVIGLVDRLNPRATASIPRQWDIVGAEQLGIEAFEEMCRRYDVVELNTALKPFYIDHLLASDPALQRVIYLDPDIMVFDSLRPIEKALDEASLLLTPHALTPLADDPPSDRFIVDGGRVSERLFLATGIFNLGFAGVRRSPESAECLDWWRERVRLHCLNQRSRGLFVDQLWMNLAPVFFRHIDVLRDPGCNVAYWNLHERRVASRDGRYWVNEVHPLVFFHFSAYDPLRPDEICRWFSNNTLAARPDLAPLFQTYRDALFAAGYEMLRHIPCALPVRRPPKSGSLRKVILSILDGSARHLPRAARVQLGRLGRLCLRLADA